LDLFSTPFDTTAIEFLEAQRAPAYKIASFEIVDVALLRAVARTGKPLILSTGLSTLAEIEEAVWTVRAAGAREIALLKCTSAYPAPPEHMNLRTLPHLAEAFGVSVGLSDHTLGTAAAAAAVALGAAIVEKHFTLSRRDGGPDSTFSLEPAEFRQMVDAIRIAERALGSVSYNVTEAEAKSRVFRRSLFVVKDMAPGEPFTPACVRSIRPGHGLHPRYLGEIMRRNAACAIPRGTPLSWQHVC
jgi:N-acetylneuraminate synthase